MKTAKENIAAQLVAGHVKPIAADAPPAETPVSKTPDGSGAEVDGTSPPRQPVQAGRAAVVAPTPKTTTESK